VTRVAQISDSHAGARGGVPRDNLRRVVDHLNHEVRPDFVVHTGDAVALDPDLESDRVVIRELLSGLDAPYRLVPGNHDIGDVGTPPWNGLGTTPQRIAAYREFWGADHWVETVDGWTLIGFDSQLVGTGLSEEAEQWRWLEEVARSGRDPVILFSHRPAFPPEPRFAEAALTEAERGRLLSLFEGGRLRALGSGHLHHFKTGAHDGIDVVWAPAVGAIPWPGEHAGLVVWDLDGGAIHPRFEHVPGLEDREFSEIPELAEHMAELNARGAAASAELAGATSPVAPSTEEES
jgi:3',5'-cyclic AMP phosphodiesterase CpdA